MNQAIHPHKKILPTKSFLFKPRTGELQLWLLVSMGIVALALYLSWWLRADRLTSPWLVVAFVAALAYGSFQLLGNWLVFLAAPFRPRRKAARQGDLSVDVFVTACGEPHALIRKCLAAACAMYGQKQVWLLDDAHDPALAIMAAELGAGYLIRRDRKDAKAGNLNAALARTQGDIIAIFDIDHVPAPDFLEQTVGHFADPTVGFVQAMLTFDNGYEGWVAEAGAESSFDFYNPTSKGMDTLYSATMMGSNSLIRRQALASIGNYQPGLAEDLATSVALHAAGWRSIYVAEPLAPGMAPPDLGSWFTQQFKWARGVFEVLLVTFPRLWGKLNWGERVAYAVRMTMYWLGPVICAHLLLTIAILLWGSNQTVSNYAQYLWHLLPLAVSNVLIHSAAIKQWRHPALPTGPTWKAVALVYATWPFYTLAWLMALLRIPLAFRPTPKTVSDSINPLWLAPQALSVILLLGAALYHLAYSSQPNWLVILVACGLAAPQLLFFWQCLEGQQVKTVPDLQNAT
ncbi:MAG TPA: glycosyltransferase [Caldilineaceae bacterium]|nr:glycosyltransferase [Caldilineaceae bacterium]